MVIDISGKSIAPILSKRNNYDIKTSLKSTAQWEESSDSKKAVTWCMYKDNKKKHTESDHYEFNLDRTIPQTITDRQLREYW